MGGGGSLLRGREGERRRRGGEGGGGGGGGEGGGVGRAKNFKRGGGEKGQPVGSIEPVAKPEEGRKQSRMWGKPTSRRPEVKGAGDIA